MDSEIMTQFPDKQPKMGVNGRWAFRDNYWTANSHSRVHKANSKAVAIKQTGLAYN